MGPPVRCWPTGRSTGTCFGVSAAQPRRAPPTSWPPLRRFGRPAGCHRGGPHPAPHHAAAAVLRDSAPSSTACPAGARSWPCPSPSGWPALADPPVRRRMDEARTPRRRASCATWPHGSGWSSRRPSPRRTPRFEGRSVGGVAREQGKAPFDALLDVVVSDGLRTGLRVPIPESEEDWAARAAVWLDPRAVVGGSDAGAHLDTMCGAVYSTSLLGEGVRRRGLLSWEQAVRQLTEVPARLYGLRRRGRLAEGVGGRRGGVSTPRLVGLWGPSAPAMTCPAGPVGCSPAPAGDRARVGRRGAGRWWRHGELTGESPGAVLRSGKRHRDGGRRCSDWLGPPG